MRYLCLLTLFLSLATPPLYAQGWLRWARPKSLRKAVQTPTRVASQVQISAQLERRTATSFEQAKQTQAALNHTRPFVFGEPVRRVLRSKDMPTSHVYPDKPFLTTRNQTANYMAAQSNRLFVQEVHRMEKLWAQLDAALPQLQEQARRSPKPQFPISWLAQHIPNETSLLLIGEVHTFVEIRNALAQLVIELKQKYPSRSIFVFTEFLPENLRWTAQLDADNLSLPRYHTLWQKLYEANIPIIGLEPDFILTDRCQALVLDREGKTRTQEQWAQLEGVRLRNERWSETLTNYRTQYPDALFIVYTGAGHSLYNAPFALSSYLPQEHPFVVALFPDKYPSIEGGGFLKVARATSIKMPGPLERLTQPIDFPQQVLSFDQEELSKLAGFNVRIRLPISIEQYCLENDW